MIEALGQALKLQAVLLAAGSNKKTPGTFWGSRSTPIGQRDKRRSAFWSCGQPDHFRGNCRNGKEAENDDRFRKRDDRPPRDMETAEKI
jgi:hypothetical protein